MGLVIGGAGWHCSGLVLWPVSLLVALWWVGIVVSLVCCGGSALLRVLCAVMAWHCGSCACWGGVVAGLACVGVVSQQVGIMAGLACHVGMVSGWHHSRSCAL